MGALDPSLLASAIDGMYEAAAAPMLWPAALKRFAAAVGGVHGLILYAPPHRGWHACSLDMKECVEAFFDEGWMPSNVRAPNGIRAVRQGQTVFSERTIFQPGELDRAAIQNDFFDRFDLRCFFGFDFVPGQILATIERGHNEIADWELEAMRQAVPHFRRIGQLALVRGLGVADGAVDALDALNVGAIAVDHQGLILRMNAAAEAICPSVLSIRNGRMQATHTPSAAAFDQLVSSVSSAGAGSDPTGPDIVALPRPRGRPIMARAVPMKGAAQDIFQRAKALVMLIDADAGRGVAAGCLGPLFGMTPTEAGVAEYVTRGVPITRIADRMGISTETVRTHLKAVFLKTGTHRQAELCALLGAIV